MFDNSIEPVLIESKNRYTVFPIEHHEIWKLYEEGVGNFWTVEEIDFSRDMDDWKKLSDNERYFIKNVLAFFAASDGIVNENLIINFYKEVQISEMRQFYATQIQIEAIHAHAYSLMIETYVDDKIEKERLFDALESVPTVKTKSEWALKWISNGEFNERLLAFIIVEGIFFSGSFCAIFWLKNRGLLPGLTTSNEFISRDEALHCRGGIALYNLLKQRLSQERVHQIFREAVEIEKVFVTESLPVNLIGMNGELMKQYIEYIADFWLLKLGHDKIYNSQNPFDFMQYISLESFGNFFETRISSYRRANVGVSVVETQFTLDEDF
jgi:ribonucleoside-diphosphate reductase beta chain